MKNFPKTRRILRMANKKQCESNPILLFFLKELPSELENVDRCKKKIPPVLARQLENFHLQLGRINVKGNGYCGYYVIQLLVYMNHYRILSVPDMDDIRAKALQKAKIDDVTKKDLVIARRHYLEYIEVGIILSELIPDLNIGVIVETNVKKTGEKRTSRVYPIRVVNYRPGQNWSFLLLSHGAHHYELLTSLENGHHRSSFFEEEAEKMFECCRTDYPKNRVQSSDQVVFLDVKDFVYF